MPARFDPARLAALIYERRWTITRAAAEAGVTEGAVRRWLGGGEPGYVNGLALAKAFGVEPSSLLTTPEPAAREA